MKKAGSKETNFEKITATPQALGEFLRGLPILEGPWDKEFQKRFCRNCRASGLESCEDGCPDANKRNNPEWWLSLEAKEETK